MIERRVRGRGSAREGKGTTTEVVMLRIPPSVQRTSHMSHSYCGMNTWS